MAHCPYNLLQDIEPVLDQVRSLEKIKEAKPGIFYLKSQGFLHFHINKENLRWADVRHGGNWTSLEMPFKASKKIQKAFIDEVRQSYEKMISAK